MTGQQRRLSHDRRLPRITTCCVAVVLGCLIPGTASPQAPNPRRPAARMVTEQFPTSTPEEQGMDSVLLAQAIDHFNEGNNLTITVEDLDRFDPDPTWTMTGTASKSGIRQELVISCSRHRHRPEEEWRH